MNPKTEDWLIRIFFIALISAIVLILVSDCVGCSSSVRRAENGDYWNRDNDGDGRREPIFVEGYYRKDGTYVRSHYRAAPR